jgi:glycosyltransferase involved in cell wall biosynthesis
MRIVIDMQGAQTESRLRGIGRHTLSLTKAIARNRGEHEIVLALNGLLSESIEPIRSIFDGLLPQENIRVWHTLGPLRAFDPGNEWRRAVAEVIREAFIESLRPDVIFIPSLFEGFVDDAVTSVGAFDQRTPTVITLYDLIPMMNPDLYFSPSPAYREFYTSKIAHLRRASRLVAISESAREEAITYLGLNNDEVSSISSGVDEFFKPVLVDDVQALDNLRRFGISRPYVLCVGNSEERKNMSRLFSAYAKLPKSLRASHQLVHVGRLGDGERAEFDDEIRMMGLENGEVIFTGYVSDLQLCQIYSLCKLFVFPSWHEGFGLPPLEAMACGAPAIAANVSSLPEVIGNADALFDPFDIPSISQKIVQALLDDEFRLGLARHGLQQSKRFSWDSVALRTIEAIEATKYEQEIIVAGTLSTARRPIMAYVLPLPLVRSGLSYDSAKLLSALSEYYEMNLVVEQKEVDLRKYADHIQIRDVQWLLDNAASVDRVVYQVENSPYHAKILGLLEKVPGVVVLQDFFLSELFPHVENGRPRPNSFVDALYHSHGYGAVLDHLENQGADFAQQKYPVNLSVFQQARGVIVRSEQARDLTAQWVGPQFASQVEVIPQDHTEKYFDAIERYYAFNSFDLEDLVSAVASIDAVSPGGRDFVRMAAVIDQSFPPRGRPRQLLVDISYFVHHDAKSGIQRVVRNLLQEWTRNPPHGYRFEPVYASENGGGYRYARAFMLDFVQCPGIVMDDDPICYSAGDTFLGLDLGHLVVLANRESYEALRRDGVDVRFVVYDLLPMTLPEVFLPGMAEVHEVWLNEITTSNGVICISKAVADEVREWLNSDEERSSRFVKVDHFHLGADLDGVIPTTGVPDDSSFVLGALKASRSFLMVGTLEPRKGQREVLAAFENLWAAGVDVSLVIVGKEGWLVEDLAKKIKGHVHLGNRLFWFSSVSDEYLAQIYGAASCLIAASKGEGFGLPLIEAAQHNLPIIARDIPVFREVAGAHASYFTSDEPEDLARDVVAWLEKFDAGEHPLSTNMPHLTWAESASQLAEVLLRGK